MLGKEEIMVYNYGLMKKDITRHIVKLLMIYINAATIDN